MENRNGNGHGGSGSARGSKESTVSTERRRERAKQQREDRQREYGQKLNQIWSAGPGGEGNAENSQDPAEYEAQLMREFEEQKQKYGGGLQDSTGLRAAAGGSNSRTGSKPRSSKRSQSQQAGGSNSRSPGRDRGGEDGGSGSVEHGDGPRLSDRIDAKGVAAEIRKSMANVFDRPEDGPLLPPGPGSGSGSPPVQLNQGAPVIRDYFKNLRR